MSDKVFSLAVVLLSFMNLNELGSTTPEVCLGLEAITAPPLIKNNFILTVQLATRMSALSQFIFWLQLKTREFKRIWTALQRSMIWKLLILLCKFPPSKRMRKLQQIQAVHLVWFKLQYPCISTLQSFLVFLLFVASCSSFFPSNFRHCL